MPLIFANRRVVVSGGASCANDFAAPIRLRAPLDESVARK